MKIFLNFLLLLFLFVNYSPIQAQQLWDIEGDVFLEHTKPSIYSIYKHFDFYEDHIIVNYTGTDTIREKLLTNSFEDSIFFEGMIDIIIHYKNGEKCFVEGYYDNGKLFGRSYFSNKKLNGESSIFFNNGQLKHYTYYFNNRQLFTLEYYFNGQLKSFIDTDVYDVTGNAYSFYKSGKLKRLTKHIDSTKNAFKETSYYENGQVERSLIQNLGVQNYTYYYQNGQLKSVGEILNMPLFQIGKWQEWYENGILKSEFFYNEKTPNLEEGTWSWWNEEGKLIRQEKYKEGKLIEAKEF